MRPKIPITSFKNYSCVFFFDFKHVFETCIYSHLLTKYKASYFRVNRADLRINFFFCFFLQSMKLLMFSFQPFLLTMKITLPHVVTGKLIIKFEKRHPRLAVSALRQNR